MAKPVELEKLTGVASRFRRLSPSGIRSPSIEAVDAWEATTGGREPKGEAAFEALRLAFRRELARTARISRASPRDSATPRRGRAPPGASSRRSSRCSTSATGFSGGWRSRPRSRARNASRSSADMISRAPPTTASRRSFSAAKCGFGANAFQGKGFRSLGQEAIYGAAMRLRRGAKLTTVRLTTTRGARRPQAIHRARRLQPICNGARRLQPIHGARRL